MKRVVTLTAMLGAATLAATALAAATGARARLCAKGACVSISRALAKDLSQRNGSFMNASAPKPAPYFRIVIKSTGEGYIDRTIVWVPSRKLWFDKQYVMPPLAGYWRTDERSIRPQLAALALAHKLRPFPAPRRWATVLPH